MDNLLVNLLNTQIVVLRLWLLLLPLIMFSYKTLSSRLSHVFSSLSFIIVSTRPKSLDSAPTPSARGWSYIRWCGVLSSPCLSRLENLNNYHIHAKISASRQRYLESWICMMYNHFQKSLASNVQYSFLPRRLSTLSSKIIII